MSKVLFGIAPLVAAFVVIGCSDAGEDDGGGSGGQAATTSTTGSPASTSGNGPSSTSSTGGTGSSSSTGGGVGCLAPAEHPEFTLPTGELCVKQRLTAAGLNLAPYGVVPTWGAHDGLLTFTGMVSGGLVTAARIEKWSMGAGGAITAETHDVTLNGIPMGAFMSQAIASGTADQYAVAWSGGDFANEGGLILLSQTAQLMSFDTTGVTGLAGRTIGQKGFFAYTGLSVVAGPHINQNASYTFDATGGTVANAAQLEAWGAASGPTTFDADGNLIAVAVDFIAGDQEVRAFRATATGVAGPGVPLATIPGYGDALAALRPRDALPGIVAFQANDANDPNQKHLDVVGQRYTDDGTVLAAQGTTNTLVDIVAEDVNVTLTGDTHDQIWLGISDGASGAVFFVLGRPD